MDTFVAKMDFPDFFLVFPWNAWLALLKNGYGINGSPNWYLQYSLKTDNLELSSVEVSCKV